MGTLVVVRHAQASLFSDDYDVLSELGCEQARALGEFWADHQPSFSVGFSGPARRHQDTATLVGDAMQRRGGRWPKMVTLSDLDEHDGLALMRAVVPRMSAGDPEFRALVRPLEDTGDPIGRSRAFQRVFERVMSSWLEGQVEAPTIESWLEFRDRVRRGFQHVFEKAERGASTVVFTSVGPIAVLLQHALSLESGAAFRTAWRLRNCSLSTFVFRGDQVTLDRFNEAPHLSPNRVTFR